MGATLERWETLLTSYDESPVSGLYLLDESDENETNLHFVFTDKRAADVRRTCDPKVSRLVERHKVMVMKGVFDKL